MIIYYYSTYYKKIHFLGSASLEFVYVCNISPRHTTAAVCTVCGTQGRGDTANGTASPSTTGTASGSDESESDSESDVQLDFDG